MDFQTVVRSSRNGAKLRRKAWITGYYILKVGDGLLHRNGQDAAPLRVEDYLADDWQCEPTGKGLHEVLSDTEEGDVISRISVGNERCVTDNVLLFTRSDVLATDWVKHDPSKPSSP